MREFRDGTRVDVFFWNGPGYMVQFVQARVVNEKMEGDKHWIKVEFEYEKEDSKLWVPRWRVRKRQFKHSLSPSDKVDTCQP